MKKILIGYDGSPCAEEMIKDLDQAGLPAELKVVVMSVADVWLPPDTGNLEPAFPDPFPRSIRAARERAALAVESARTLAQDASERLRSRHPGWKVEAEACADSPGWALVKKADSSHVDLVVVGSHGRSALERLFLGSVSQKVAAEAHCAVRIVRPRRDPHASLLRLVVAMDGSEDSRVALESVLARAWPKSTAVRVATVLDPHLESSIAWSTAPGHDSRVAPDEDIREGVRRRVEEWSGKLGEAGLQAEAFIYEGDPKHELLKMARGWEADAIFLGARGLQHGGRFNLGTTADAVAARAHCTVEIVRAK